MKTFLILNTFLVVCSSLSFAQQQKIPSSYSNLHYDKKGLLYFIKDNEKFYADTSAAKYSIQLMIGKSIGTDSGIALDFDTLNGSIIYGLVPYGKSELPSTVYKSSTKVKKGKANINIISTFSDSYEIAGMAENGQL